MEFSYVEFSNVKFSYVEFSNVKLSYVEFSYVVFSNVGIMGQRDFSSYCQFMLNIFPGTISDSDIFVWTS